MPDFPLPTVWCGAPQSPPVPYVDKVPIKDGSRENTDAVLSLLPSGTSPATAHCRKVAAGEKRSFQSEALHQPICDSLRLPAKKYRCFTLKSPPARLE